MRTAFHDKRITVVGLARSGAGAANLLAALGAHVTVTDAKTEEALEHFIKVLHPSVRTVFGSHPDELFSSSDLVVVSPGVPMDIAPLKMADAHGIPVIGELELAYSVLHSGILAVPPRVLAVTGTNGKSTTTALLHEMLLKGGIRAIVGGNIGNSIAAEVLEIISNPASAVPLFLVIELSSFQLESIERFRPFGATILNVTPDHLDRYHDMQPYIEAKCRIAVNQQAGDFIVLNADDPVTGSIEQIITSSAKRPTILYFSRRKEVDGAYMSGSRLHIKISSQAMQALGLKDSLSEISLDPSEFRIKGVHNIENAMVAALMAALSGCSEEGIRKALTDFPGLEHRLEFVRELDGVKYINDSKGTNVGAVLKSLEGFTEPVILIAGGKDKDSDFRQLRPLMQEKVRKAILIGDAAEKIRVAVADVTECIMTGHDFRAAVERARAEAEPGDVVLLSPACASFDMFRDFEDRGRQFRSLVMEL